MDGTGKFGVLMSLLNIRDIFFYKQFNLYLADLSLAVLNGIYHFKKANLPKKDSWRFNLSLSPSLSLINRNANIEHYCCLIFFIATRIFN